MQKTFFQLEQSEWWVLLIVVITIGLTWFLYSIKKTAWSPIQNWILSILRAGALFLILILLLDPLLKNTVTTIEEPIITLAIDNSQSVTARSLDTTLFSNSLDELTQKLEAENIEVRKFYINNGDSNYFDQATTNLSSLLGKVESDMESRNWAATVLFSDGIYNGGSSPLYRKFLAPQFTIGLGDTIPPKDINLSRVQYNRVSFKGNETPIRVEVSQKGFDNQEVQINLLEDGKRIQQKSITLAQALQEVEFVVKSEEEGLRKMVVTTSIKEDEFIANNNRANVFMEIIDGRQKVLIVAEAPHPDIKAIRSALDLSDNYETDLWVPSINQEVPTKIYDVIIYHGAFNRAVRFSEKENPGIWYILNNKSHLPTMNRDIPFFHIQKRGSQPDKVTGSFNQSFSKFKIPEGQSEIESYPPIAVPFGEYSVSGPVEVLMYQRLGSITTKKPLFLFFDDGSRKGAILAGQDIWKWKFQESAINGNADQFNNIVTKTVQFLSVKNDQKQFRFTSRGNNFSDLESVIFDAEVYNDIYERIYGNQISVRITSDQGQSFDYTFTDSEFNSTFKVPALASGIYTYRASVEVGDNIFSDRGQFLVEEINREYLNLTADHNLLRSLSAKTDGQFLHYDDVDEIGDVLLSRNFKQIVRSNESFFPLIESRWILLLILMLFSSEWLLRKYWGGY